MSIISENSEEKSKPQTLESEEHRETTEKFLEMSAAFQGAIDCVMDALENIKQENKEKGQRTPIHSITSRIKSPESTQKKLTRHGLPYTIDNVMNGLHDIAGVRVICKYISDIYGVRDILRERGLFTIVNEKDYIKSPKPSGYRSLHLIAEVGVQLGSSTQKIRCEIQIRTSAMDSWASLEHNMRYKSDLPENEQINESLKNCAEALHNTDLEMQRIAQQLRIIS